MANGTGIPVGLQEELRWFIRIAIGVGGVVGGTSIFGAGQTLQDHALIVGHPVMVERVQSISTRLDDIDRKLEEVLRLQRQANNQ